MTDKLCPCHSQLSYDQCCRPYHDGAAPATAAALMRSRYCAYAMGLADYIMATTHQKNAQFTKNRVLWGKHIQEFVEHTHFVSLSILDESAERGNSATVTFRAGLVQDLKDASFTERSTFQKVNGRWLYVSGDQL